MSNYYLRSLAVFAMAILPCTGCEDDCCIALEAGICQISVPAPIGVGTPIRILFTAEIFTGTMSVRHDQQGQRIILTASECPCCADCACTRGIFHGEYEIPPLPAGKYKIEAGSVAPRAPDCAGATAVDVVVPSGG